MSGRAAFAVVTRACPKCHGRQTADWLRKREAEMLPCDYFHVVATVPGELRTLFLRHQKILYGLLMKTADDAVRDLAGERRYVGAEVGILAVLHTWTGELHHHPHVHMLVTGGGVSADGTRWHEAPSGFLVPVNSLRGHRRAQRGRLAQAAIPAVRVIALRHDPGGAGAARNGFGASIRMRRCPRARGGVWLALTSLNVLATQ